jgi:hypothetical protein
MITAFLIIALLILIGICLVDRDVLKKLKNTIWR